MRLPVVECGCLWFSKPVFIFSDTFAIIPKQDAGQIEGQHAAFDKRVGFFILRCSGRALNPKIIIEIMSFSGSL